MKRKILLLISIVLLLLSGLAAWAVYRYQSTEPMILRSGSVRVGDEDISVQISDRSGTTELIQSFLPQRPGLDIIRIFYLKDSSREYEEGWAVKMQLIDPEGKAVVTRVLTDKKMKAAANYTIPMTNDYTGLPLVMSTSDPYEIRFTIDESSATKDTPLQFYLTQDEVVELDADQVVKAADNRKLRMIFRYDYYDLAPMRIIYRYIAFLAAAVCLVFLLLRLTGQLEGSYLPGRQASFGRTELTKKDAAFSRYASGMKKKGPNLLQKILGYAISLMCWVITPVFAFWFMQTTGVVSDPNFQVRRRFWFRNLLIYYMILILLTLLIRQVRVAVAIYLMLLLLVALVAFYVFSFRGRGLALFDVLGIGTAMEVVDNYHLFLSAYMGMQLIRFMIAWLILVCLQGFAFPKGKLAGGIRLAVFAAAAVGMFLFARKDIVNLKVDSGDLWNVNHAYRNRGFAIVMGAQVRYINVDEPEGYSVEQTAKITEEIRSRHSGGSEEEEEDVLTVGEGLSSMEVTARTKLAASILQEEQASSPAKAPKCDVVPENIIIIMNESLSDLEVLGDVKTNDDLQPYWRELSAQQTNGYLHMPVFGAGTSDSEYEVLTGNTKQFLPVGSNAYELYTNDPEYGLAVTLKDQGYYTIAMHPNKAKNWSRNKVYPYMQFDEFISNENWGDEHTEKIRNFLSDQACYDKILEVYRNKEKGQKLFTFCVTMQNHGGYTNWSEFGYEPFISLNNSTEYPVEEFYLSLMNESDLALYNLTKAFEEIDEPTMIVIFGDHQAKITTQYYTELMGTAQADLDQVNQNTMYMTPYMIWTNYGLEQCDQNMSANYLGAYALKLANLELSPYEQLVLDLKSKLPVYGIAGTWCGPDGTWYNEETLPDEYRKMISDYQILQYNHIGDRKHLVTEAFVVSQQ